MVKLQDEERDALKYLVVETVAETVALVVILMLRRVWNMPVSRSRWADKLLLTHNEFQPVQGFVVSVIRKLF